MIRESKINTYRNQISSLLAERASATSGRQIQIDSIIEEMEVRILILQCEINARPAAQYGKVYSW